MRTAPHASRRAPEDSGYGRHGLHHHVLRAVAGQGRAVGFREGRLSAFQADAVLGALARGVDLPAEVLEAVVAARGERLAAGRRRLRPIFLTSLTTFAGLLPIVLEPSAEAALLKPAAVSLAFGVLAASAATPLLVPALYALVEERRSRSHEGRAESRRSGEHG